VQILMETENRTNQTEPWGIKPYDQVCGGLPKRVFTLLRCCSEEVSIVATAQYLKAGIDLGQRVSLVCFDHPDYLLDKFKSLGFNFVDSLLAEQMIYLYYKPFFSHALNLATNYKQLFDEAIKLSMGNISRIAFLNTEVIFNLETYLLAEASAQKIIESARTDDIILLGSYHATNISSHRYLDQIGRTLLSSFLEIASASEEDDRRYKLILHKLPLLFDQSPIDLIFAPGSGFVVPNIELIKYG